MRSILSLISTALFAMIFVNAAAAQDTQKQIRFINCNVFDGMSDKLAIDRRVLVEGNPIKTIGDAALKAKMDSAVVDCGGRTLIPGLIDNNVHLVLPGPTIPAMEANKIWADLAIQSEAGIRGLQATAH